MQASRANPRATAAAARREPFHRQRVLLGVGAPVAAAALCGVALAALLREVLALDAAFVFLSAVLMVSGGGALLAFAAVHWSAAPFGAANCVTLARAALVSLLAAMLGLAPAVSSAWAMVAIATVAALLDAVDGWFARRRGEATAFGARFDMETDALLILVLAALAWQLDKAGAWVLLAGGMRYAFVAASFALPWLAGPLPPRRRRQTVCVVQIIALIVCISPVALPPASGAVALLGLALLAGSFALDVAWLARRAHG